jgi:hypothetical protein
MVSSRPLLEPAAHGQAPQEFPRRRAARTRAAGRAAADRRLRILERLTTRLSVAHIAREEGLTVTRIRQILAVMQESREIDPPAGFVQIELARLSEAMIVARTMTRSAMCSRRTIDQADGRTRPLSWLRQAARFASRGRFAAAEHSRGARRIAGAFGSHDENFPGYKALKSHEMEKESVGWSIGRSESAIGADGGSSGRPLHDYSERLDRDSPPIIARSSCDEAIQRQRDAVYDPRLALQ